MKTVLPLYPGKKSSNGTIQKIISQIPQCEMFIDAMCGSGFVGSNVTGSSILFNDIDSAVIDKIKYAAGDNTFTNLDYTEVIQRFDTGSRYTIFYFDPPYLLQTRSSKKAVYKFEWNDKDHLLFLTAVKQIKCPVMISHYKCKLYDEKLKGWRKVTYNTMTRAGVRVECLYLNYPVPALLQCFDKVGENFTDRQRIQRKVERLKNKLTELPEIERAAVLSSLVKTFTNKKEA